MKIRIRFICFIVGHDKFNSARYGVTCCRCLRTFPFDTGEGLPNDLTRNTR